MWVQRWAEKERIELEGRTIAALCQIAGHCSRQDVERWPAAVTTFFDISGTSSDSAQQLQDVGEAAHIGQDPVWDW